MTQISTATSTSISTREILVIITVMLVAILEVLDSTIVSVSLPSMMGELGANTEEITWVLISYIVSSVIVMPLTGFLNARFGRRRLLLTNISGFLISSMLCGIANDITMMVIFRAFQGAFGATLIPLSQSTMRETFPLEKQPKAMAIWGVGIMSAPVLGPTIGAYITNTLSWHWIFYLNLPICLASFIMALFVIKETPRQHAPVDWQGMALMACGIGSLQIFLDKGNEKGWFESDFIIFLALLSFICLVIFIIRGWRKSNNIVNLRLYKDRNFALTSILLLFFAGSLFSLISIQPIMMESLMGYPVMTVGLLMAPRGIASAVIMMFSPLIMKKIGAKPLLIISLILCFLSTHAMSTFNLATPTSWFIVTSIFQGAGMALFFVPLSTLSLATLAPASIPEGSGLFNYARMVGTSIDISLVSTIISRESQINWQQLGAHIQPFSAPLAQWLHLHQLTMDNPLAKAELAAMVGQQASMIAYLDAYWLISVSFLLLIPFIFLLKPLPIAMQPTPLH